MKDFTRKELLTIMEDSYDENIKKKAANLAGLTPLQIKHTYFIYPNGNFSKKYATAEEAHAFVQRKIGEWSKQTADEWSKYMFVDIEYGNEYCYSY